MKYCRVSKKMVPDEATICPYHKTEKCVATFGAKAATAPARPTTPSSSTTQASVADRNSADGDLQFTLRSLETRIKKGRKRSAWLTVGTVLALIVGAAAWGVHHFMTVMTYAELGPGLKLERDAGDRDRLNIRFRPTTAGRVGFLRQDPDRETELIDNVRSSGDQAFKWRWAGMKPGNVLKVTHRDGWSLVTRLLTVPEPPPPPKAGDGVLVGEVVDATTNKPLEGASVKIVGTPLVAITGKNGRFRLIEAPTGPVGIEVIAPNFSMDQLDRELAAKKPTSIRVALSPGMSAGQMRVVLTWGAEPNDLDAHLQGPLPDDQSFHVYFGEKGDLKSKEFVSLDVDDRDGEGPETITVLGVLPGRYHYFVHDYSNAGTLESDALGKSGAEVKLYQGGQTYRFKANNQAIGNHWHVCDINVAQNGTVTVQRIDEYEKREMQATIAAVDVLFLMDTTGSMDPYIDGLKQNCIEFATTVANAQRDCRLGLVGFGDSENGDRISVFPPSKDARLFQRKVRDLQRFDGGDIPESPIDAVERTLAIQFRDPCVKVFVLITDAPCHRADEIPDLAKKLAQRGIRTHVVAPASLKRLYGPLCEPNGKFHPIDSARFEELLLDIAEDVKRYTPAK